MLQDSLDILVEALGRFGHYVSGQHELLLQTLLPHLDDNRAGVRKRALQAVGEQGHGGEVLVLGLGLMVLVVLASRSVLWCNE